MTLGRIPRLAARLPQAGRSVVWSVPLVRHVLGRLAGRPRRQGAAAGDLRPVVHLPDWCRWDHMRQRPHALASAFARAGHDVFFIDQSEPRPRVADGVNIVPWLSETPRSGVILMVHYPQLHELFDRYDDAVVLYDIHDDLTIFDPGEADLDPARRVKAHHPVLMEGADVVVTSSAVLDARHRPERQDLLLIPNGVDVGRWRATQSRPLDIPPGPVAGYHGAIADWFDFELLETVATSMPEWTFALVGPVLEGAEARASRLGELDNVVLIGERTPEAVVAYVQAFDVGLIPFRLDEMTEAVSPLKLFEYLAAGVPVVSTPLPASVTSPATTVAATADEFVAAISRADRADVGWRALAATEGAEASWDERLRPVLDRLEELGLRRV